MLKYQSVAKVLAQTVQQDPQQYATAEQLEEYLHHSSTVIISSILVTGTGRAVSSYHNTRIPPIPRHDDSGSNSQRITPYHVDRQMKTKVYGIFAANLWDDFENNNLRRNNTGTTSSRSSRTSGEEDHDVETLSISTNSFSSNSHRWLAAETDDALFVIYPVFLKTSKQYLLLTLVADPATPLGFVSNKAKETAKVLEKGLVDFKVYEE